MDAFLIMVKNVILFAALAVPGYLLVKCKILKQEHSAGLSKLLMYVGMPFLILSGTVNNLTITSELMLRLLVVAVIGIAYTFGMYFISIPITSFEKADKTRRMMRFCAVFSNNGFLGIPLAKAVFKDLPAEIFAEIFTALIVLNIITNIMMYVLGSSLVAGDGHKISIKTVLLNPVLIAFVVGLALNLLKVKNYIPEVVTYSDYFSGIVTPVSMTILGMKLATVKFTSLFTSIKNYYVSALKLVVFPVVIVAMLFAAKLIPGGIINNNVILGFFIAFAVPTAGLASTYADMYDGDADSAVKFTLGSTILSIITIPVIYGILNLFI